MLNNALGVQLGLLEAQLADMAKSLLDSDPERIRMGSQNLQHLAGACAQILGSVAFSASPQLHSRLQALARDLGVVREQLARRQAYVDQSLKLLIPAAQPATYGAKGLYAGANRASGSLRPVSA